MEHKILFYYCVKCGSKFARRSPRAVCRQCVKVDRGPERVNSDSKYKPVPSADEIVVVGLPSLVDRVQYVRVEV